MLRGEGNHSLEERQRVTKENLSWLKISYNFSPPLSDELDRYPFYAKENLLSYFLLDPSQSDSIKQSLFSPFLGPRFLLLLCAGLRQNKHPRMLRKSLIKFRFRGWDFPFCAVLWCRLNIFRKRSKKPHYRQLLDRNERIKDSH